MIILQAPYPLMQTTTLLPDPLFSDSEAVAASLTRKLAIDGTRYTYVKQKGRRKLRLPFRLTRNKALELRAFIQCYFGVRIKLTDHRGRVWVGNLVDNPFELEGERRAGPAISPMPRGESVRISLDFEGVQQ